MNRILGLAALGVLAAAPALAQSDTAMGITTTTARSYDAPYANQGVGVDAEFFYAVDNEEIGKYSKETGELVAEWVNAADGPAEHFDSAVVVDGLLYASHSNYPEWPMTSSVEIFDAATMEHIDTHSFGIQLGSLTWIDHHDGAFYGTFANYNRVFDRSQFAYGQKFNTQVVRFDANWQVVEGWIIPEDVLERFEDMSNSGGSFGPDGRLWLSGHDPAEVYVMELPEFGSELVWVATVPVEIEGQGISWDRSAAVPTLYGIVRPDRRVTVTEVTIPAEMMPAQ